MLTHAPTPSEFAQWRQTHPPIAGADDGDGGGDGGQSGGSGGSGGQGSGAGQGSGSGGGAGSDQGKTFTQDELDRILETRLNKQRQQYKDYDDLKAAKKRLDDLEASQQSDLEKLQGRATKAEEKATEAEKRATEAEKRANATLIRAAVVAEAAKQQAADPSDVYQLLDKDQVSLKDDGKVEGAEQAVKDLLDAKPHLKAARGSSSGFDGGTRQTAGGGQTPGMNDLIRQGAGVPQQ